MSLNGLDDPVVTGAYQAALNEAGGWLLLKYATRDTVDLLEAGTGGVVEVRVAIGHYHEKSPVYGLVQYRRRKVILKYVPEGTSRLLQARLSVQFQSVLEKFTPHDTVFSFAAVTELTEAALSSACRLHASIGSLTSSNSSLYRRRLDEIAEDAEETGGGVLVELPKEEPKSSGLRHSLLSESDEESNDGKDIASALTAGWHLPTRLGHITAPAAQASRKLPASTTIATHNNTTALQSASLRGPNTQFEPPFHARAVTENENTAIQDEPSHASGNPRHSWQSRQSAHSTHASVTDADRASVYSGYTPYRPKVKVAPRPAARRPVTPGSNEGRPVANLPHSVRVSSRQPSSASRPPSSASSHRPNSQLSTNSVSPSFFTHHDPFPPPLPQTPIHISALYQSSDTYLINRPSSPAPSTSTLTRPAIAFNVDPLSASPEKQRLMRALQLRKRQQLVKARDLEVAKQNQLRQKTSNESAATQHSESPHSRTNKNINHPRERPSTRSTNPTDEDTGVPPSKLNRLPGQDPQAAAEAPRVDSSLDSKDAEVTSSTSESESATSVATNGSLKRIRSLSKSPRVVSPKLATDRLNHDMRPQPESETSEVPQVQGQREIMDAVLVPPAFNETMADFGLSSSSFVEDAGQPDGAKPILDRFAGGQDSQASMSSEQTGGQSTERFRSNGLQVITSRAQDQGRADGVQASSSTEASDTSGTGSLYDEIQSAIVAEAKPVTVARAPFSPVFNNARNPHSGNQARPTSTPSRKTDSTLSSPERSRPGTRHTSSTFQQWPPPSDPAQPLLTNKRNVSLSISKRIKALEVLSARSDGSSTSPSTTMPPSPPLTAGLVKKRMSSHSAQEALFRTPSASSPPATKLQHPLPAALSASSSSSKTGTPVTVQRNLSSPGAKTRNVNAESISATSRIVQNSGESSVSEAVDSPSPPTTNLRRSLLFVRHDEAEGVGASTYSNLEVSAARSTGSPGPLSVETETAPPETRRFSLASSHSTSSRNPQRDSFAKRLSMGSRSRSGNRNSGRPVSVSGSCSSVEDKGKRGSRKARLVQRMSALVAGASRRSTGSTLAPNPLQDGSMSGISAPPDSIAEDSGELSRSTSSTMGLRRHMVDIGDVNIQFPDTLLWKRRFMRIDEQGYLILTPPTMEANRRGISRRFHLSEFKKPCLPSVEREELPWSIVLDLEQGSSLQCAGESRYAQTQMMRILLEAHDAHVGSSPSAY